MSRYWSYEKNGVVEDGKLIHTQEEIEHYKVLRQAGKTIIKNETIKNKPSTV